MRIAESQSVFIHLLRGLSAVAVLVGHTFSILPLQDRPAIGNRYDVQTYAVLIFFILSGLLIAQSALARGPDYRFADYIIDRASRIFVCFIPALFFIAALDFLSGGYGPKNGPGVFLANVLMLQRVHLEWVIRAALCSRPMVAEARCGPSPSNGGSTWPSVSVSSSRE